MEARLSLDYSAVFSVLSELVEVGLVVLNASGEIDFASQRARTLLGCGDDLILAACYPEIRDTVQELTSSVSLGRRMSAKRRVRHERTGTNADILIEVHTIDEDACSGFLLLVKDGENMRKMATDLGLAAQFRNTRRLYRAVVQNLKQPISAVMLHADLMRDLLAPEEEDAEPPKELRSLTVIKNQIVELNRSLTLLLEEIEPSDTEERGFSLREVIEDVRRLIDPVAEQQETRLLVRVPDHAARLNGHRQRVKQAILNLAVNALDAMPDGGTLRIELSARGGEAEIRVADTGKGIDPDVVPHVFEMHYTTKETGTGVGLYVAREVVEKHGGTIELETEPGGGAMFLVKLPVSENGS